MAWVNCGFCGVWNQCNTKLVCVSCNNVRKDTVDKAARAESRAAQAERRVKDVEADVATLRRKVGGMRDAAFCDVTLQTCDGEAIEAHRCILAAWSPVFTTMFSSGFLEETKGVVSIPDTDSSTVEQLVSFMYRGEFHVESATMKEIKLLVAADKYEVMELKEHLGSSLCKHLNDEIVFESLKVADMHGVPPLRQASADYILSKMDRAASAVVLKDMLFGKDMEGKKLAAELFERGWLNNK